ncbi:DUF1648 domain-containing protein [Amedibacillus sp. YH-ame6]
MKNRLYDMKFMVFLPFVISLVSTFILLFYLPMDMPMQFAGDGSVNWSMNKYLGVWLIPAIGFVICRGYQKGSGLDLRVVLLSWLLNILNIAFLVYTAFLR